MHCLALILLRQIQRYDYWHRGIEHILGTDNLGRDVLARVIYGIRISLAISLVSVALR